MICPSESSIERVKVSHVIVECRVINHHPSRTINALMYIQLLVGAGYSSESLVTPLDLTYTLLKQDNLIGYRF